MLYLVTYWALFDFLQTNHVVITVVYSLLCSCCYVYKYWVIFFVYRLSVLSAITSVQQRLKLYNKGI